MLEAKIIDRGRGPEVAGTRITVYDVLDYHNLGWHRDMIAVTLSLSSQQVEVAIRYIEEHRDEVLAEYEEMLARDACGNPPELQAKLDAGHERFLAMVQERREAKKLGSQGACFSLLIKAGSAVTNFSVPPRASPPRLSPAVSAWLFPGSPGVFPPPAERPPHG